MSSIRGRPNHKIMCGARELILRRKKKNLFVSESDRPIFYLTANDFSPRVWLRLPHDFFAVFHTFISGPYFGEFKVVGGVTERQFKRQRQRQPSVTSIFQLYFSNLYHACSPPVPTTFTCRHVIHPEKWQNYVTS